MDFNTVRNFGQVSVVLSSEMEITTQNLIDSQMENCESYKWTHEVRVLIRKVHSGTQLCELSAQKSTDS